MGVLVGGLAKAARRLEHDRPEAQVVGNPDEPAGRRRAGPVGLAPLEMDRGKTGGGGHDRNLYLGDDRARPTIGTRLGPLEWDAAQQ